MIGCGSVTEVKSAPAYALVSEFEMVGVTRRNLDLAKDYAKRHNIKKVYASAQELITSPEINAVYIATPPNSHLEYALQVAKAGKICCIEKPMAPSYKECVTITQVFQEKKLPLFVAYYRRSLPRFNKVKELLAKKTIGTIRHIEWHLSKPANDVDISKQYNWRTDSNIAVGGYFDDLASHGLDLFVYLLGDITQAQGLSLNQQNLYTAKDAIVGNWIHQNHITGSGNWNFGTLKREDFVRIYGDSGKITFSVFAEIPITLETNTATQHFTIKNPKHIHQHHVQNMQQQLFNNQPHPSTGKTATHTAWVLDKILGIL
jgi:predicted dehydrogenase